MCAFKLEREIFSFWISEKLQDYCNFWKVLILKLINNEDLLFPFPILKNLKLFSFKRKLPFGSLNNSSQNLNSEWNLFRDNFIQFLAIFESRSSLKCLIFLRTNQRISRFTRKYKALDPYFWQLPWPKIDVKKLC